MQKEKIGKFVLLAVIGIVVFTGCELFTGPEGPAGANGARGLPGPSLYLQDSLGNRYYSGGSIYLGYVEESGVTTLDTNLNLVNETGEELTLAGSPYLELVLEYSYTQSGASFISTFSPLANVVLDITSLTSTIPAAAVSPDFIFTINFGADRLIRRRYRIDIDGETDDYDFVFEVYGYSVSSAGW